MNENEKNPFEELVDKIPLKIFHFLGCRDLARVNRVSKKLHELTNQSLAKEKAIAILSNRNRYLYEDDIGKHIQVLIDNKENTQAFNLLSKIYITEKFSTDPQENFVIQISDLLTDKFKFAGYYTRKISEMPFEDIEEKQSKDGHFELSVLRYCIYQIKIHKLDEASILLLTQINPELSDIEETISEWLSSDQNEHDKVVEASEKILAEIGLFLPTTHTPQNN